MTSRRVLCLLAILLSMAVQTFAASLTQPVIVAHANRRNVTQAIPQTTLFTPAHTGLFRVSAYLTVTSPGSSQQALWAIWLNYNDDSGVETYCVADIGATSVPPNDVPLNCLLSDFANPFVFEAVAGRPVTFRLDAPQVDNPGIVSVGVVVERIE